jgi:hypothetical protein
MNSIKTIGYLPGYGVDSTYQFSQRFEKKISVSFDTVEYDPGADFNVLVQCEPPELYYRFAGMVQDNYRNFDLILTYDERLLKLPNAREFCPVGSWIDDDVVISKRDQISYLMSSKVFTNAHRMRFMIMRRYSHLDRIGEFEFLMHRSPPRVPSKNHFFANAKFNIACENQILPNMFTEKILDCFKTKTVPIYFGCTNLSKYFDVRGVLQFYSIEQLADILSTITPADYDRMLPYVEENYRLASHYWQYSVYQRIEEVLSDVI